MSGPLQTSAPSVPPVHRERHGRTRRSSRPARVELGGQPVADDVGEGRVRERVPVDGEQPLGLVEQLVEVGQEGDPLAVAGPRAGAGPVRTHPAHVGRHRVRRDAVLARRLVAVGQQMGARPHDAPCRDRRTGPGATGVSAPGCRRPRSRAGREPRSSWSAMFLTCMPGGSVSTGPASKQRDRGAGRAFAQDPRVRRAGRPAADDDHVDGFGESPGHGWTSNGSRVSLSRWSGSSSDTVRASRKSAASPISKGRSASR